MKWIKKKLTNLKQVHNAIGQIPLVLKPENNPLWLDALSSGSADSIGPCFWVNQSPICPCLGLLVVVLPF